MQIVPRQNTPITAEGASIALRNAWENVFGAEPARAVFLLLAALIWVETGRGKSVQNFNVGNITAGASWPGDAWRPPWFDFDGGTAVTDRNVKLHEEMLKGRAPSAFRAYSTLEKGTLDFVRVLRASFPAVIEVAATGDAESFRAELSKKYSADYRNEAVTQTFESVRREFERFAEGLSEARGSGVAVAALVLGTGLVGVIAWRGIRSRRKTKAA